MQREPREHDPEHLAFIRTLPCVVCGDDVSVEAAHIRMADLTIGKKPAGIGHKPHDKYCVPLCGMHHRAQHDHGDERDWWGAKDPVKIALALYSVSGRFEPALRILSAAR